MSNQANIPKVFHAVYEKLLEKDLVIGKVANRKFEADVRNYGDRVNVGIGFDPTLNTWTGGDVGSIENISSTSVEIAISEGRDFNFRLRKKDEVQVIGNKQLVADSIQRIVYKMRDAMDADLAGLYTEAGILVNSGSSVAIDSTNAYAVLEEASVLMDEANVTKMNRFAILPSRYRGFIELDDRFAFPTAEALKIYGNGYAGKIAGFDVMFSNNITVTGGTTYHPIFGVTGETLALAVQKEPEIIEYIPEASVDNAYKGICMYGVKAYREDKLATLPVTFTSLLS